MRKHSPNEQWETKNVMIRLTTALITLLIAAPAWSEGMLFCMETASQGFYWEKESASPAGFEPNRWMVKVISETKREIIRSTGDTAGRKQSYICRRPFANMSDSQNEKAQRISRQIVCHRYKGGMPWIFHDNTFMRAYLSGPPTGSSDPNAYVSYGNCVRF